MKNHFIIPYWGNKRTEVYVIYDNIKPYIDDKTIIVEPFCGSSSISFYISLQQPKKYKYILNDIDKALIEMYNIMKDDLKLKNFVDHINNLCFVNDKFINKETYLNLIKKDDVYGWFIKHKFYRIRPGLYDITGSSHKKLDYDHINNIPIINFLRTEDVLITNNEAIDIYEKYKDMDDVFFIMDPPYIMACNDFYTDKKNLNIYEYIYYNHTNNKNICFVLENYWIISLLFNKYKKIEYAKRYTGYGKKKTTHIILINDYE